MLGLVYFPFHLSLISQFRLMRLRLAGNRDSYKNFELLFFEDTMFTTLTNKHYYCSFLHFVLLTHNGGNLSVMSESPYLTVVILHPAGLRGNCSWVCPCPVSVWECSVVQFVVSQSQCVC